MAGNFLQAGDGMFATRAATVFVRLVWVSIAEPTVGALNVASAEGAGCMIDL